MTFNEDSLKKWNESRPIFRGKTLSDEEEDENYSRMIKYSEDCIKTIDEIKQSDIFTDIIQISTIYGSGRKPKPSCYIWIVLKERVDFLPSVINGFDIEYHFESEDNEDNTIYI